MAFQTYTKFAIIGIKFQLSCKHVHDPWPFHLYMHALHCTARTLHSAQPIFATSESNAELQNEADL